jgi:hypothetical protein
MRGHQMALKILAQEILREELDYDPDTGIFMWRKKSQGRQIGIPCGSIQSKGYRQIRLFGKSYLAHRLAWMYVHGSIDENMTIDHINQKRDDNRIINLRQVTFLENQKNKGLLDGTPSRLSKFILSKL